MGMGMGIFTKGLPLAFHIQDSASVTTIICAMDQIISNLHYQTGKAYHPSLAAAMTLTHKKMDHYYSLTNASTIYCITMVLHPGMKLKYFHKQKWPSEWIEEVEHLVQEEYVAKYEKVADESNMMPTKNSKSKNDSGFASFSDLSVTTAPHASEILKYLKLPVENIKDPLKWWVDNQYVYPNLYHMALDYLSIPSKCGLRLHDDNSDTMFSYFYLC